MFSSQEQKIDSPIVRRTLEDLDLDSSEETKELMDPVSLQLLIIPLKPSRKSQLQAVELGSLREHLQARRRRRAFHPLDPSLALSEDRLKHYVLDEAVIKKRDVYLSQYGYSLDEFLSYRGLTRAEYQQLVGMFHHGWVLPGMELGLLGLVAAAGIGGYLYGKGPPSLFFCFAATDAKLRDSYQMLQGVAGSLSILTTMGANFAWNKSKSALETVGIASTASLMSFLLLFSELYLLTEFGHKKEVMHHDDEPLGIISIMMAKLCIPVVQGELVAVGKSFLSRFSLFSQGEGLVKDYTKRKPLAGLAEPHGLNLGPA